MSKMKENRERERMLAERRRKHERIIDNLLSSEYLQNKQSSERSQSSQKSIYERTQNIIYTGRSMLSCSSDIHKQVNLLSNLGKYEQENQQSKWKKKQNHLDGSLFQKFDVDEIGLVNKTMEQNLFHGDIEDFKYIVEYLNSNGLWNDLFSIEEEGIFVKIFGGKQKAYDEINIAYLPISENEVDLVVKQNNVVFIGYLLLHRTLSYIGNGNFAQAIRGLLSYAFKWYSIGKTKEYIELQKILKQKSEHKLNMKVYGKDKVNELRKIEVQQLQLKMADLVQDYEQILVMLQEQFCYTKKTLIHNRNHHIVLDMSVQQNGYYILSNNGKGRYRYKVCVLSNEGKIVCHFIQNNKEFKVLEMTKGQYKIYIAAEEESVLQQQETLQFTCVLECKSVLKEDSLQLKFKEEYNKYTQKIINQYLKGANIMKLENEILELIQKNSEKEVFVIRCHIKILQFYVDFICLKPAYQIQYPYELRLIYEGCQVFCDLNYHKNTLNYKLQKSEIIQIYLSKNNRLVNCSNMKICSSKMIL